jgi:NAD(P)-dependent dehydrogenase (short-subunit alcohol dehydrogenase family)
MKHLPDGGAIINTSSINGLRGNASLIDYSATKGAINALTYALAQALDERASASTASPRARCGRR